MLVPIPECSSRTTVVFMDGHGETIGTASEGPMYHTVAAVKPAVGELVFLPDSVD